MRACHTGVITFGVLGIVFGLIGMIYNGFILFLILILKSRAPELDAALAEAMNAITGFMQLSIALNVLTGGMVLVGGIGIFSLKAWARMWYLIAAGITIINRLAVFPLHFSHPEFSGAEEIVTQTAQQTGALFGDLATIVFNLLVLWFFNRSGIRKLFQPIPSGAP